MKPFLKKCRYYSKYLIRVPGFFPFIFLTTVKLKPSELNVPDKGKEQFEAAFGESWDSAIAAGKIYNAKDGAEKLGLDSEGVNAEWGKLSRGKDLIKFGGGFYCGKVKGIYVMNGFYMSMRAGEYRVGGSSCSSSSKQKRCFLSFGESLWFCITLYYIVYRRQNFPYAHA